jgi:flagella basal body P-ring formation protein FlgA
MRFCAELAFSLLLWPAALGAQAPQPAARVAQNAPTPLIDAIARSIARHWNVEAAAVRVESVGAGTWPADSVPFTLLGDGADGTWILATEDATGPRRWTLRAGTMQRVARATNTLERGVGLTEKDFVFDNDLQWGPPRREEVTPGAGWITKRRINAGEILRAPLVEAPRAVRSGETVRLVLQRANVTLVLTGKAIGSAALGERIMVRADTGKRVEGVVIEPGIVRLDRSGGDR